MKRYIFLLLLIIPTIVFADMKDDAESVVDKIDMNKMTDDAKNTINSGQGNYKGAKGSANVQESKGLLDGFSGDGKGGLGSKLSSLMSDTDMQTLDGKKRFNGQLICAGNKELGVATYSKLANRRLSIQLNLGSYGLKAISNISSLCSAGFQSRTGETNYGYSFTFTEGKLNVSPNPKLTECMAIDVASYEISDKDFDFITAQIIQFLANSGFDAVSGAEKVTMTDGSIKVKFNSQSSEVCGIGGTTASNDIYGYTPSGSLYQPNSDGSVNIPDGSGALLSALNDNNSIYYLLNKSLDVEYKDGAKVGGLDTPQCSIQNTVVESSDYVTQSGCVINPNTACVKYEVNGKGSINCYHNNQQHSFIKGGSEMSGSYESVCGEYEINVISSNENTKFAVYLNGEEKAQSYKGIKLSGVINDAGLIYKIVSLDNVTTDFFVEFTTTFKKSEVYSVIKNDTCIAKKECKVMNEKICNTAKDNCIQTVKNTQKVSVAPAFTESKTLNGNEYKITANGNAFILEDIVGKRQTIKSEDAFFVIDRELTCPSKSADGLKDEAGYLDDILGGVEGGDYDDLIAEECATQFCIVDKIEDNRAVLNNATGETRLDIGNAKSLVTEVRTCTYKVDKYICPYDVSKNESLQPTNDCSCDTDKLLNNIGGTLAGLEVLRQISDKNAQKCGKK